MRVIHKHTLAEQDLIDIWQYTVDQWGEEQADKYLDELDQQIRLLIKTPELGSKRDHVRTGYRVLFVNRHAVYYFVTPSIVHIVRVLHVQMDPDRHF